MADFVWKRNSLHSFLFLLSPNKKVCHVRMFCWKTCQNTVCVRKVVCIWQQVVWTQEHLKVTCQNKVCVRNLACYCICNSSILSPPLFFHFEWNSFWWEDWKITWFIVILLLEWTLWIRLKPLLRTLHTLCWLSNSRVLCIFMLFDKFTCSKIHDVVGTLEDKTQFLFLGCAVFVYK